LQQNETGEGAEGSADDFGIGTENLFCIPSSESKRLQSIIARSKGSSVLVTGYCGGI
jgi:hypothetical protein